MIILAHYSNGYVGCEGEDVFFFPNNISSTVINEELWQWACEKAESYAYVHFGCDTDIPDDEWDEYIDNVTFDYDEISYDEYVSWCENYGYAPDAKEDME